MTRRNIFNEVLAGLREIAAFERGGKALRSYRLTRAQTRAALDSLPHPRRVKG